MTKRPMAENSEVDMTTILCIEDETLIRRDIALELKDAGYDIVEAENGEEGLNKVLKHTPDLILCDINMPVMDGYEFLKKLRRDHPEYARIPIIFLTAYSQRDQVIEGKKMGADDYITKPVDFDAMLATVESRLRQIALIGEQDEKRERIVENFFHDLRSPEDRIFETTESISVLAFSDSESDIAHIREKLENRNYVFFAVDRWDKLEASLEKMTPDLVLISMEELEHESIDSAQILHAIRKRGLPMVLLTPTTTQKVEGMQRRSELDDFLNLYESPTMVAWTDLTEE